MVEAGELAAHLDLAFDRVASYREKYEATTKKIRSALAYPLLVIVVAIAVLIALVVYVVPVFATMYESFGAELPTLTRIVVKGSELVQGTFWYWFPANLLSMVAVMALLSTTQVKMSLHRVALKLPIIKDIWTKVIAVRFCRTAGSLLSSGVDIIRAVEIASRTTGNYFANQQLQPIALHLAQGKSLTEALSQCRILPSPVLRLSASGEKTGRLGEMLQRAADYYESETETQMATLHSLIEPIIIIFLGCMIGFFLISMYLPLFELVETIQ